jgi:hypothetical protein
MEEHKEEKKEENGPAEHSTDSKVALKLKRGDYKVHIFLEEARGLVGEGEG